MTRTFYAILANSLVASLTNTCIWFAVTFWAYLQTRSVLVTSVMAGIYLATVALSGFFLGSLVDRYRKKQAMLLSSVVSLALYLCAGAVYVLTPKEVFVSQSSPALWVFIMLTLFGAIAGNIRSIALSTSVTFLVREELRDKANGLVGTANGVSFLVASIFSGLLIGFVGMLWTLGFGLVFTIAAIVHLLFLHVEEKKVEQTGHSNAQKVDVRGTIKAVRLIPGLFGLIFFNTFNNFLGGVFMSLMDAYGLSLVSVQAWGVLWGFLSLGFIVGGVLVARRGLGPRPLRSLFLANIIMWSICSVFTLQSSIILLTVGMFVYLCLIPVVEAAEQTIIQKVIPPERQGRVFGFAQSIEQAASPITAFFIGPIAQYFFIPFMTTGAGVNLIGDWFGTGAERGLALLFTIAGILGLIVTLLAMRSDAYLRLSENYCSRKQVQEVTSGLS